MSFSMKRKATRQPAAGPSATQPPEVNPSATQLPAVNPDATQLPAAGPSATQLLATTPRETQLSKMVKDIYSHEKPVSMMYGDDFIRAGCSRYVTLDGMSWIGNRNLWFMGRKCRTGIFADPYCDGRVDQGRSQWAISMGRRKKCLVGVFNSCTEREVLRLHLRHGGKAIWILGKSFPEIFDKDCRRAFCEGRLLVVSCFWIPEWIFSTYRYCCQLVAMCSGSLVFWSLDSSRYTDVVYRRCLADGVDVKLYSSPT